jgi:phytoene dehydrogenase-like protein
MENHREGGSIGIIGGGVTGLIAGCYARMNGYETDIFESHNQPGGLCTSWKKGDDYTIDGCIEWLVGVNPKSGFHRGWLEVGALQGKTIIDHEVFAVFETPEGRRLSLYSNVDRLEKHLLEFSPQDSRAIKSLCANIRLFAKMDAKEWTLKDLFLAPLHFWNMAKVLLVSNRRFAQRFKDPLLREVLNMAGMEDLPAMILILTLAWHHNKNGGYPIGGSLEFSKSIERRFKALGGRIHYLSKVEHILEEKGRATGVRIHDGKEFYFDRIISAGDGRLAFDHLLGGRYNHEKLRKRFDSLRPFTSLVMISFGVRRDLSGEPHSLSVGLKVPIMAGGKTYQRLRLKHFAYDPTLAPPGRTVLVVGLEGDYDYWTKLHQTRALYDAEKNALALKVLDRLEERFPGIGGQVEVTDVATPVTFERYTHNWRGSIEGWLPTLGDLFRPLPKTLKGLKGLYFAGQWVQPGGGLPTCLMTGRGIVKLICREDGRSFQTSLPETSAPAAAKTSPSPSWGAAKATPHKPRSPGFGEREASAIPDKPGEVARRVPLSEDLRK